MANLGEVKVPITFEMTDTAKQVLRSAVVEILQEVLASTIQELVREEVRKALADLPGEQARAPYKPRNLEYKSEGDNPDLPAWARNGQWS